MLSAARWSIAVCPRRPHAGRDRLGGDVVALQAALGQIDAERDAGRARHATERDEDLVSASFRLGGRSHLPWSANGRGGRAPPGHAGSGGVRP
jgi:hypothetical protein